MKVYRSHQFKLNKSIKPNQIFEIIDRYMFENNLSKNELLYFFQNYICEYVHNGEFYSNRETESIAKLCKKYPELEPLHRVEREPDNSDDNSILCNYDKEWQLIQEDDDDELIRLIVSKIPRPYNFCDTRIYFNGVNFFGEKHSSLENTDDIENPGVLLSSHIKYDRDGVENRWNLITLCLDITGNDNFSVRDDSKYLASMKDILPKMYRMSYTTIIQDKAENDKYEKISSQLSHQIDLAQAACAKPIGTIGNFIDLPNEYIEEVNYSLKKSLTKEISDHGYEYLKYEYYLYSIRKIDCFGHAINFEIVTAPICRRIDTNFTYSGLGFHILFGLPSYTPKNQEDANKYIAALMEFMDSFEKEYLLNIGSAYPKTPEWYWQ